MRFVFGLLVAWFSYNAIVAGVTAFEQRSPHGVMHAFIDLITPTAIQAYFAVGELAEEAKHIEPTPVVDEKPCAPNIPCPPTQAAKTSVTPPLMQIELWSEEEPATSKETEPEPSCILLPGIFCQLLG